MLVVDDDVNTLRSVDFVLQSADYDVTTATNGADALAVIRDATTSGVPIDLVVTDIQMPAMNGLSLIDEIRLQGACIPILPITAYGDDRLYDALRKRGCTAVLEKPFDDAGLVGEIGRLLGND